MNTQLFLDSIRFLCSDLETRTLKVITKPSPLSNKMERISRSLIAFKVGICQSLHKLIQNEIEQILPKKLKQQLQQAQEKLRKLELHALLQRKIKSMQQDSIMNSMTVQDFNSSFVEDPQISQLKNSVVLIQKDLGIYAQDKDEYDDDVSSVIHRSMASLQATPIANRLNSSSLSSSSYSFQNQHSSMNILGEENQNFNKIQQEKTEQDGYQKEVKKMSKKGSKKKKNPTITTVYSTKGGMLDNLLQESYQSYIE